MLVQYSVMTFLLLIFDTPDISRLERPSAERVSDSKKSSHVSESVHANLRLSEGGRFSSSVYLPAVASRSVCIEGFGPAEELADWLAGQVEIEELSLIGIRLTNADVRAIIRLPRLSRLDLRGCEISRQQLACLRAKKSLGELDLRGTVVLPDPIHALRAVKAVSSI